MSLIITQIAISGLSTYSVATSESAFVFFFNDTATTEIYTLSLHDALPISAFLLNRFPVRRAIMFMLVSWFGLTLPLLNAEIGRAVQQECRDRSRMPSSA